MVCGAAKVGGNRRRAAQHHCTAKSWWRPSSGGETAAVGQGCGERREKELEVEIKNVGDCRPDRGSQVEAERAGR